jgi:dihydroorotase
VQIEIRRPDDWHLHLRDGAAMAAVVPFTAARFARAIVMPNLKPPVTTTAQALAYRERILQALPAGHGFSPLMTLYLTDRTDPSEIEVAGKSAWVKACKLYPAGATTNSDSGVTDIRRLDEVLARMSALGMPLLVHGEVTGPQVDVFEREHRFIDEVLAPTLQRFPRLRVVFEHITTARAVEFVKGARDGVGATITPHEQGAKENACGCAGMFSAHAGIELYAEAFDSVGMIDRLEGFASDFGADFYGLPRNDSRIRLARRDWSPPANYPYSKDGAGKLVPMRAGESVRWQLVA